jgi:hypothetical protein
MWITVIFIAVKDLKNWSFSSLRYFNHTYNMAKRITLFDLCFKSKLIELTHCIVFYFIIRILLSIQNSKEFIFALLIR